MNRYIKYLFLTIISGLIWTGSYSQTSPLGGGFSISSVLSDSGFVYWTGGAPANVFKKVAAGEQTWSTSGFLEQINAMYTGAGNHILARDCDGNVFAWGNNSDGQLGNGLTAGTTTPVRVLRGATASSTIYLENVQYVSTGNLSSYALMSDGRVVSWGSGNGGRLGHGANTNSLTPVYVRTSNSPITFLNDVIEIAGMENSAAVLRADGTVWTWGANTRGECGPLGAGNIARQVTGLPKIVKIVTGDFNVYALDENKQIWSWGGGSADGTIGDGYGYLDRATPGRVVGINEPGGSTVYLTGVVDMAAGQRFAMALLDDGRLVSWGGMNMAASTGSGGSSASPRYVETAPGVPLTNVLYLGAGDEHGMAMTRDGRLYTWGRNQAGQLGLGNTTNMSRATEVTPLPFGLGFPCPVAGLGPDVELCNPIAVNLYAGSYGPSYKYEWYRNGTLLSNNDDNYATGAYFLINTPGTYRVIITDTAAFTICDACPPSEDVIEITTASVSPINNTFCAPPAKNVVLRVDSPLSTFNWYNHPTNTGAGALVASSTNTFTTHLITESTTYYVEDTRLQEYPNASTFLPTGGTGLTAQSVYSTNVPGQMTFTVEKTLTIKSVVVGTLAAGTNVNIRITGPGGPYDHVVPTINNGTTLVTLDRTLGPGTYTMAITTGFGNLRVYSGATYPRGVTGLITFNNPINSGYRSTSAFYDWLIEAPTSCGRIPVEAIKTTECPAPIELISFTGKKINDASHLFWSTAQEVNSSHFEVQRSFDGIDFQYIGEVKSRGNSNSEVNYTFIDNEVRSLGKVYYRLRQVDNDETYSFTHVIVIDYNFDMSIKLNIYPNPVEKGNQLNITALSDENSEVFLTLLDLTGKVAYSNTINLNEGYNHITIETFGIPKGMYLLIAQNGGQKQVLKVVAN